MTTFPTSPRNVPLFSAAFVHADIDLKRVVGRVVDSAWYVLGEEVRAFEAEFARHVGVGHCVSVANGTDALEIALRGVGVRPGDRVVTVANAGFYASVAIHRLGGVPLYVDVAEDSLNMAPDGLATVLAQRPAAVIATHLYGQLADVDAIARLCREAGVPLIEDCAQAHGAVSGGRRAGSFGDVACFSFYPTKNLGALGDGGALVTNDPAIEARMRSLRQYGWAQKYTVSLPGGFNSRLDELQAAVLREKLPLLDRHNQLRRRIAGRYQAAFASLPVRRPVSVGEDFAAHLYVLRVERRDDFRAFLRAQGVATEAHYPVPDHRQPAYEAAQPAVVLAVTEAACRSVVSLPLFPGLPDADVDHVIGVVQAFFAGGA